MVHLQYFGSPPYQYLLRSSSRSSSTIGQVHCALAMSFRVDDDVSLFFCVCVFVGVITTSGGIQETHNTNYFVCLFLGGGGTPSLRHTLSTVHGASQTTESKQATRSLKGRCCRVATYAIYSKHQSPCSKASTEHHAETARFFSVFA